MMHWGQCWRSAIKGGGTSMARMGPGRLVSEVAHILFDPAKP